MEDIIIVIIDDNFSSTDPIVIKLLDRYKDVFVVSPKEAIAFIKENIEERIIVLLDISMPGHLDGHQTLVEIRKITELIPVILFTAINEKEEEFADFINNHVLGFVSKGASSKEILKKVKEAEVSIKNRVDYILASWLANQDEDSREKPYLMTKEGNRYSMNDLLREIQQQTEFGKKISSDIIALAIDLLGRNKRKL